MVTESPVSSRFLRYQFPALLWALVIFTASSIPSSELPPLTIFKFDKLLHAGIFLVFAILVNRAFAHQTRWPFLSRHSLLLSLLTSMIYGALDEAHQLLVPGRSADPLDFAADTVGALLFVLVFSILVRIRLKQGGTVG